MNDPTTGKAVMVLGRNDDVLHAGSFGQRHPSVSIEIGGLNCMRQVWYWATGILALCMIHSPMLGTCWPCQVPAGTAYSPQWMNMPKRASRHHFIRALR